MYTYILRRFIWGVVTIWLVVTAVFLVFYVVPGGAGRKEEGRFSPVAILQAGRDTRPETLAAIEKRLGLDQPVHVQYSRYLSRLVRGDLGFSWNADAPVRPIITARLSATAGLAIGASVMWAVGGVGIGILSAKGQRSLIDNTAMAFSFFTMAFPIFVAGIVGIFVFDTTLGIYGVNEYVPISKDPLGWAKYMWLPCLCLAFPLIGIYARMTRGSLLGVRNEDYIRTALAKGLDSRGVLRHQFRSALTPLVTMYGVDLGVLLGGSIIIENIFNIPGVGQLALGAMQFSDLPIVLGITILASTFIVVANIVVDIAYAVIDPRVRYTDVR